jgi:hypothetical protein
MNLKSLSSHRSALELATVQRPKGVSGEERQLFKGAS